MKRVLGIGCLGVLGVLVILIVLLVAVGIQGESTPSPEDSSVTQEQLNAAQQQLSNCSSNNLHGALSYDTIFREHPAHSGKSVCFKGEIIQVVERGGNQFHFRINVTEGQFVWTDTVYATWEGKRFLDEDIVEFAGIVQGLKSYSAVLGQTITIPEIRILAMRQKS